MGYEIRFKISNETLKNLRAKWLPTAKKMEFVGLVMKRLCMKRFETQGASGGTPWPAKRMRAWGYDDGRSILTGRSAGLKRRFFHYAEPAKATLANDTPYAHVHQLGTVGKGGTLPTIRPKGGARALFIPITDRAINSQRQSFPNGRPVRVAHRMSKGQIIFSALKPGRLHNGKLQVKDERPWHKGEWRDGVPDFIWLGKVDIAKREMLPVADTERREIAAEMAQVLLKGIA